MVISSKGLDSFFVQIHPSNACNLRCKHCYLRGVHHESSLPLAQWFDILQQISEMLKKWEDLEGQKIEREINFAGGEPLVYPHWELLISRARELGFSVTLLTNGTLLTPKTCRILKDMDVDIQISIDGTKDIHDSIRGAGAYDKAIEGAYNYQELGGTCVIAYTLTKSNTSCLVETFLNVLELGFQRFAVSRYVPDCSNDPEIPILDEVSHELLQVASFANSQDVRLLTSDPAISTLFYQMGHFSQRSMCSVGLFGFGIMPNGDLVLCSRLPIPFGNVKDGKIINQWLTSDMLQQFRNDFKMQGCAPCHDANSCRGCRAIAYALTGSIMGKDQLCIVPSEFFE